jgi:hypothetical protein
LYRLKCRMVMALELRAGGYSTASTGESDCCCDPGFAGEDPEKCVLCPAGYYCPKDGHVKKCLLSSGREQV